MKITLYLGILLLMSCGVVRIKNTDYISVYNNGLPYTTKFSISFDSTFSYETYFDLMNYTAKGKLLPLERNLYTLKYEFSDTSISKTPYDKIVYKNSFFNKTLKVSIDTIQAYKFDTTINKRPIYIRLRRNCVTLCYMNDNHIVKHKIMRTEK